jgi:CheY-like chemotaxis protein
MKDEKLEILVVEDTPKHQESARVLLVDHNTQIVGNFDSAIDAFKQRIENPAKITYDVVLTDMFFPQGRGEMQGDKSLAQIPQDLGTYLAMYAAQQGVPYVAICSDANHHDSTQTYAIKDLILKQKYEEDTQGLVSEPMKIGEKTLLFNIFGQAHKTPDGRIGTLEEVGDRVEIEVGEDDYPGENPFMKDGKEYKIEHQIPEGSEQVKNWAYVLEKMKEHDGLQGLEQNRSTRTEEDESRGIPRF